MNHRLKAPALLFNLARVEQLLHGDDCHGLLRARPAWEQPDREALVLAF